MTRTPARKTPALGWKFPIPPRAHKVARIAAALSLVAVSMLTAVPSALAVAATLTISQIPTQAATVAFTSGGAAFSPTVTSSAAPTATWTPSITLKTATGGTVATGVTLTSTSVTHTCTTNVCKPTTVAAGTTTFVFDLLTINTAGNYSLQVSSTSTGSADTFTSGASNVFSVTTAPTVGAAGAFVAPYRLAFTTNPGPAFGGGTLSPIPVVTVQDANGATVTNAGGNVLLQLLDQGGAVIPGTATVLSAGGTACQNGAANSNQCSIPLASGVANASLSIDALLDPDTGRGYSVFSITAGADTNFNVAGVGQTAAGATSSQFNLNVGSPSQMRLKGSPIGGAKGQLVASQPSAEIEDAGKNPIESDKTDTVSVQLLDSVSQNPPTNGAVLLGTLTQTVGKVRPARATFADLSITQNGDYMMRFTSSAAIPNLDQSPIFIRDNALKVVASPNKGVIGGVPIDPVVVQLVDSTGVVQNSNQLVTIHFQTSGQDREFTYNGATARQASARMISGTATFAGITFPTAGTAGVAVTDPATAAAVSAACASTPYPCTSSVGANRYSIKVDLQLNDPNCVTAAGVNSCAYTNATAGTSANVIGAGNTAPGAGSSFVVSDKQMLFTAQPGTADAGKGMSQNPVIILARGDGGTVSDNYHTATIMLGDSAGKADKSGAKLTGAGCATDGKSCTVTLNSGAAIFSGLSIDMPGTYTLLATTNAISADGRAAAPGTSIAFTIGGTAVAPAGGAPGAGAAPSLPSSTAAPENTDLNAINASIPALKDLKTANVSWSYLGPSAVVVSLLTPPLWTTTFPVGCYSGPNATSSEASGSVLFGTKSAGSDFILFFIRGTRAYSYDVAVGNYCWISLIAQ